MRKTKSRSIALHFARTDPLSPHRKGQYIFLLLPATDATYVLRSTAQMPPIISPFFFSYPFPHILTNQSVFSFSAGVVAASQCPGSGYHYRRAPQIQRNNSVKSFFSPIHSCHLSFFFLICLVNISVEVQLRASD